MSDVMKRIKKISRKLHTVQYDLASVGSIARHGVNWFATEGHWPWVDGHTRHVYIRPVLPHAAYCATRRCNADHYFYCDYCCCTSSCRRIGLFGLPGRKSNSPQSKTDHIHCTDNSLYSLSFCRHWSYCVL